MRTHFFQTRHYRSAHVSMSALVLALALLMSAVAVAQENKPPEEPGFFQGIANWLDRNLGGTFQGAGKEVENFGHEAGVAAKTTVNTAKDAAGAVARIPAARVMTGHEKCVNAPNGAPDCTIAAERLCKAKGFDTGKSVDMTTAEVCPPKAMLAGRTGPAAECRDETFVSRALCQ